MAAASFRSRAAAEFFRRMAVTEFFATLVSLAADSPAGGSGEGLAWDVPRLGRRVLRLASRPESIQGRSFRPGEASTLGAEIGMEDLVKHGRAS